MKRVVISALLLMVIGICGSVEAPLKQVMIDIHHSVEGANPEVNMVAITKILADFTFEIKDEPLTENLLQEYDVVMLYQPYANLDDAEIEALVEFVRKGGGLIICGEHDVGWNDSSRSTYNKLGKTFGIIFTSNAVDDPTDKMGCYCTPIIHNMAEHPLTEGVTQIVLYKPCALRISADVVAVARGDDDSKTIGAEQITGEDIVVVAVAEYERGKVVVTGSHTVFDDSFINQPDNQTFSINVFNWVSEQAVPKDNSWVTMAGILVIAAVLVLVIVLKKR
ncbi:MAG: ThuA domain-containing protein [Theionarchaea archaeon]|nr:ThuA domain-containing protein [Theionarchaea archaeon]